MKGIVLNLLAAVVTSEQGEVAWDDALDRARVGGAYTAHGSYADDDLLRLVDVLDVPGDLQQRLRWFGRRAMPVLHAEHASFFEGHSGTASFLRTLNDVIHPSVRVMYPGADVPVFDADETRWSPEHVVLGYRSPRRLCALAVGFVEGAAQIFGERCVVRQDSCLLDGDDLCVLDISLVPEQEVA